MNEGKDWNAIFAKEKAAQDLARSINLKKAKEVARSTGKEPFNARKFKTFYIQHNPYLEKNFPWKTLLIEAEYDYYVSNPKIMTVEKFVAYQEWADGFG